MRKFLTILILSVAYGSSAQINVFECQSYVNHMTQAEINAAADHFGTCIEMGGTQNMHVSGSANRTVYASKQIQLKENVYAGNFDAAGGLRLTIDDQNDLEVAVMNYEHLDQILRYKKFELGIKLPGATLSRINHFLLNEGTYPDELNPFLEWEVDVEMIFYHPATGTYKIIDGYYHREYTENPVTDDWDDIGTEYPFRVRYAPPQNGKWIATAVVKINGLNVHSSEWFGFYAVESGDPGYVKVHPNHRNLVRGSDMIFPVGHNFPSPEDHNIPWGGDTNYLGNNLFSDSNTMKAANTREWESYRSKIESYFQQGGKYIRTIQTPWSSLIEFEKKGNYYDRLHYAWEQDKLLDLCEEYDALMMFNMMLHNSFEVIANYEFLIWDWENWFRYDVADPFFYDTSGQRVVYCYNDNPQGAGGKQPHEALFNSDDVSYHQQRTRYYIARYGYSTKIYEFELLSEPFNVGVNVKDNKQPYYIPETGYTAQQVIDQQVLFDAIEKYHGSLANFIKNTMGHKEHLIGVDYGLAVWDHNTANIRMDQSLTDINIDILGFNDYTKDPTKNIITKDVNDDNNSYATYENSRAKAFREFFLRSAKPVMFSEFGPGDGVHQCSDYSGIYVDVMTAGFSGVCGYNLWEGKDSHQAFLWPVTIRAQGHMNGADVIPTLSNGNGTWIQGREQAGFSSNNSPNVVEHQYYLSNNQERSVGYVYNRTYNHFTKLVYDTSSNMTPCIESDTPLPSLLSLPANISWVSPPSNQRLRVEGLKNNTDYQTDWYSYKSGTYLGSSCSSTTLIGGKLDLVHPILLVTTSDPAFELPVVWYVIRQMNCSNGLMPIDENVQAFMLEENHELMPLGVQSGEEMKLSVYPNPFGDHFVVSSMKDDVLVLRAVDGTVVGNYAISAGETTIPTLSLSRGVYLVSFQQQGGQFKIIKQ